MGKVNPCQSPDPWSQVWALVRGIASVRITGENCSVPAPDARKISLPHRSGGRQWLAGRIHIRIRFWKATARRFGNLRAEARLANSRLGSLRDDVRMLACQRKNCCALTALDGNDGTAPRALPWVVRLRPFRPPLCGVILDEESHGFSVDGIALVLRYGRLGSLRYMGLPRFFRFQWNIWVSTA